VIDLEALDDSNIIFSRHHDDLQQLLPMQHHQQNDNNIFNNSDNNNKNLIINLTDTPAKANKEKRLFNTIPNMTPTSSSKEIIFPGINVNSGGNCGAIYGNKPLNPFANNRYYVKQ
jgi:hypothetical protein